MVIWRRFVSCAILFCAACGGAALRAEPFAEAIGTILRAAENPSPAAYRGAVAQYDEAELATPGDLRAPLAVAIAALRNQRLDDAAGYLATARERSPQSQPALRLTLWLALLRKQYDQAGVQIAALDRLLVAASPAQATHPEFLETARLLGRATEFLKGPGSTATLEKKLGAWKGPAVASWQPALAAAYAEGRAAVSKNQEAVKTELVLAKKDALAKNTEKLMKERQTHADQVGTVTTRKEGIEGERIAYRNQNEAKYLQTKDRLSVLHAQLAPLSSLRSRRKKVDDDLTKERKGKDEKDKKEQKVSARQRSLESELNKIDAEIRVLEPTLRAAETEAAGLQPVVNAYNNAMARFESRVNDEIENLKTLSRDDARLARDPTDSDGASSAVELRATSWREYAELDFAQEANRIRRTLPK